MSERQPTAKQRLALHFIDTDGTDASRLGELCNVQGGYGNEAEFILRLIDRGWVTLTLTDAGRAALRDE